MNYSAPSRFHTEKSRTKPLPPRSGHPVRFELFAPEANEVALVGSFNKWDPNAGHMARSPDGNWTLDLSLEGHYEYLFLVDGRWVADPKHRESAALRQTAEPDGSPLD